MSDAARDVGFTGRRETGLRRRIRRALWAGHVGQAPGLSLAERVIWLGGYDTARRAVLAELDKTP